ASEPDQTRIATAIDQRRAKPQFLRARADDTRPPPNGGVRRRTARQSRSHPAIETFARQTQARAAVHHSPWRKRRRIDRPSRSSPSPVPAAARGIPLGRKRPSPPAEAREPTDWAPRPQPDSSNQWPHSQAEPRAAASAPARTAALPCRAPFGSIYHRKE